MVNLEVLQQIKKFTRKLFQEEVRSIHMALRKVMPDNLYAFLKLVKSQVRIG